jgi:hypothetical protein
LLREVASTRTRNVDAVPAGTDRIGGRGGKEMMQAHTGAARKKDAPLITIPESKVPGRIGAIVTCFPPSAMSAFHQ